MSRETEPRPGRRLQRRLVLLALLVGLCLRIAVYLERAANDPAFDVPALDSEIFLAWARRIAGGDVLGDRPFFLNPLYPYFLAPIVLVVGDATLAVTRFVQMAMGLLTVGLVAGACRRFFDERTAVVAAFLAALYPLLHFYEQVLMIVTLAIFLNALLLNLLARFAVGRGKAIAFLAGLALGFSILARPNVGLFALLLPLWFLFLAPEGRSRIAFATGRTLLVAAGSCLVVLPVTLRNLAVGDDLVLVTSSAGVNLHQANNPATRESGQMMSREVRPHPVLVEQDAKLVAEREEGRSLKPSEVSAYWTRRTFRAMADEPGVALKFLGRKFLLFLYGYELPSSYHYVEERRAAWTLRLNPLGFGVVCPLALVGIGLVLTRRRRAIPLVLLFAVYAVGLTIFFPLGHYRAPVLPAAFALAAVGAVGLAEGFVRGTGDRRFLLRLSVAAALLLTNVPRVVSGPGGRAWIREGEYALVHHYNRGLHALRAGEIELAVSSFQRAREADPGSWLPDQGMADVALELGDVRAESQHLLAALEKNPGDPPTLARSGLALLKLGHVDEGLRRAEAAVRLGPRDWIVHTSLGEVYERLGRFEDALAEYELAVAFGLPETRVLADQARCLRLLGRPREALDRLERGLRYEPGDVRMRLERAWSLLTAGSGDLRTIREDVDFCRRAGAEIPAEIESRLERR